MDRPVRATARRIVEMLELSMIVSSARRLVASFQAFGDIPNINVPAGPCRSAPESERENSAVRGPEEDAFSTQFWQACRMNLVWSLLVPTMLHARGQVEPGEALGRMVARDG